MINIDKIVNKHLQQVENFKGVIKANKEDEETIVINKLLTCEPMIVYSLFETCQDHLEGMLGLFHSLRHAFLDDGEYQIVRTDNPYHRESHELINKLRVKKGKEPFEYEPLWMYSIGNDWEKRPLQPSELEEIIDAKQKAYDFYNEHKVEIEESNFLDRKSKNQEWHLLEREVDAIMARIYKDSIWEETEL